MNTVQCKVIPVMFIIMYYCRLINGIDLKGFDDTTLFKINWPGKDGYQMLDDIPEGESMIVTSHKNEKYKCLIPNIQEKSKGSDVPYEGPNALEILQPLFTQSSCSYRIDSYWTYEICHGRYVRQFHDDRETKDSIKTQEYVLGRWDHKLAEQINAELDSETYMPPIKKLDGQNYPYFQMNLTDGTMCDLNGKPRRTNVLYICYNLGKHEVYSFKETSTCEYEAIILSALLCDHPKYKPNESGEHEIQCLPLEGSPKKPRSLLQIEAESLKLRHQMILDDETGKAHKVFAVFSIGKKEDGDTSPQIRIEIKSADEAEIPKLDAIAPAAKNFPQIEDTSAVESFLSGKKCLQGGTGWWQYEFCYGKSVEQYHIEKDGSKTVIRLGTFNKEAHLDWLKRNPQKKPKSLPNRHFVSHFYGDGSLCELTGKPRETEVKLKCVESLPKGSVSLFLLEPHTCQYILGVESSLICQLLPKFDETGLIPSEDDDWVVADTEN